MQKLLQRLLLARPSIHLIASVAASIAVIAVAFALVWWTLEPGADPEPQDAADRPFADNAAFQPIPLPPVAATDPEPAPQPAESAALQPLSQQPVQPATATPLATVLPEPEAQPMPGDYSPLPTGTDRFAALRSFVTEFDGGDCFFAAPLDAGGEPASIEAYSVSLPIVEALDRQFREMNGFEAKIGFRPVEPPQCAAVNFVRNLGSSAAPPVVTLGAYNIRNGEPLAGTVSGAGGGTLSLLLVEANGKVRDLSSMLSTAGGSAQFHIIVTSEASSAGKPLLLIAIGSAMPLAALAQDALPAAEQTFRQIAEEAERSGQPLTAALKYVKLEG